MQAYHVDGVRYLPRVTKSGERITFLYKKYSYRAIELLLMLTIISAGLTGCGGVVLTTVIGGATVYDRRTAGALVEDELLELKMFNTVAVEKQEEPLWEKVELDTVSYNRIMLLIGDVPSGSILRRVVDIARSQKNVREIHDHLTISEPLSLKEKSKDFLITSKVKAAFFLDSNIKSQPIKVITHRQVVYLMGLLSKNEVNAAVSKINTLDGIAKIINVTEHFQPETGQ